MATTPNSGPGHAVQLNTLPLPQLHALQKQLNSELQHLTTSFQSLRTAQSKFRDCMASLTTALSAANTAPDTHKPILVPMTESLYVPATLASVETVLVDVGTGFFVEKDRGEAREFYERKVGELEESLKNLEGIVGRKAENVKAVEDTIRDKVLAENAQPGAEAASAA
ncbi:Prefoldin alpha subunit [Eremomyces bilateralis CBS 781.70]|uniref:Prefoldin alpha subunit n=1 Tax=Eremomyces bilateralis CBS 781.70 TaxID=1392243 RepID=A0A6G1GGY6_9PEZI|nr:Prefoldin alpha subunit [Eremomyces bilateralis CBS 781.70]KAF1817196.1 Prefoldin alpha subunit [Eremomyces bilateralis CBS 781.70]